MMFFLIVPGFAILLYAIVLLIPIAWMLFMSVMVLLMLAFSAGYYAIITDKVVAVMMTILHTIFLTAVGSSLLFLPFYVSDVTLLEPKQMLLGFGAGALFQVCWMFLCTYGTGWMGLRAFSLRRRPGFYVADRITAFDQV
jgi:hypothetical protein